MLKYFFSILAFLLFISAIYAQTADTRLRVIYSEEYLTETAQNNPNELKYLNWYLDNSYSIVEIGAEKCASMPFLRSFDPATKSIGENVENLDVENLNILLYSFERQYNKQTCYRIGDTGYAIIFESYKKLAENFNIYQDEN